MNIKEILKRNDIKLYEFSDLLEISRPTLNYYISEFESGRDIPNKKIESIFKDLFTTQLTKKQISEKLEKLKLEYRYKGDEKLEYSKENKDLMESIINKMKEDLRWNDTNNALYKFINSALYMYGKNHALTGYINYNLYLNGLKDINKIKLKEKKLVSNLYLVMKKYVESELEFNEEGFLLFQNRIKEIEKERKKKMKDLEETIKKQLAQEIQIQLNQGLNIEAISIEEILKKIKFK